MLIPLKSLHKPLPVLHNVFTFVAINVHSILVLAMPPAQFAQPPAHSAFWYWWPKDPSLCKLRLDFWAQNHFHNVCCSEESILCFLCKCFLDCTSQIFIIQHRLPCLAMPVTLKFMGVCKLDHPLLDWPCMIHSMPFHLCDNFQCLLPCVAQRCVKEQVQQPEHSHHMILKHAVKVSKLCFCCQLPVHSLQLSMVPKEVYSTACGQLSGSIVGGIPMAMALKLPCLSAVDVLKIALCAFAVTWFALRLFNFEQDYPRRSTAPSNKFCIPGIILTHWYHLGSTIVSDHLVWLIVGFACLSLCLSFPPLLLRCMDQQCVGPHPVLLLLLLLKQNHQCCTFFDTGHTPHPQSDLRLLLLGSCGFPLEELQKGEEALCFQVPPGLLIPPHGPVRFPLVLGCMWMFC